MECLKENKQLAERCTEVAKTYLMCRMDAYASDTILFQGTACWHVRLHQQESSLQKA